MLHYKLGVILAVITGIMLSGTSSSAASVIDATSMTGNQTGNSTMKSGNTTSAGSVMNKTVSSKISSGNITKASNMTKVTHFRQQLI